MGCGKKLEGLLKSEFSAMVKGCIFRAGSQHNGLSYSSGMELWNIPAVFDDRYRFQVKANQNPMR